MEFIFYHQEVSSLLLLLSGPWITALLPLVLTLLMAVELPLGLLWGQPADGLVFFSQVLLMKNNP